MGLYKQYLQIGQYAKTQILGHGKGVTPLQLLVSQQGKVSSSRIVVLLIGIFTLAMGIVLSSIPWVDYVLLKNLRLWNGSLSFSYWQKPGVIRLTKVYIFNVTNPDNFLNLGEKPKLQEIGPFVYREDMEKVNIKFNDNGTLSYQHKKILQFVPELSVNKEERITVPNIPLLTLSSQSNSFNYILQRSVSWLLTMKGFKPFVSITADELVFGYDDTLVNLAHNFYPKRKKPKSKMGLLINRNGTLNEIHSIHTGERGMQDFGYLDRLNGLDHLPYWQEEPCSRVRASEGSFFPPRYYTKADVVHIYDKDLCRVLPLKYRGPVVKHGINVDLYTPTGDVLQSVVDEPENKCFCPGNDFCPPKGLQSITPCHFDAPVYISYPHFWDADPSLIKNFEGLEPIKEKHESYLKIQPRIGVPLEAKLRVQLNLKVDRAPHVATVAQFPSIIYPIMWIEEGIDDLTPPIRRWIYLATTFTDIIGPLMTYGFIFTGSCILIGVFINGYKSLVFTKETIEISMKTLRKRSRYLARSRVIRRDAYDLLSFDDEVYV